MTQIKHGDEQRKRILDMGLQLWRASPSYVTARRIADELGMSHSNILYHFKGTCGLRDALAYHAIKQGDSQVIMHLIAERHASVANMPDADRMRHMKAVG